MRQTSRIRKLSLAALIALAVAAPAGTARAQDLEPRAYSASPVGLSFALVAFSRSTGGVVTDPSIPVTNAEAHINAFTLGYGHTFGFLGRQALITAGLPYAWGDASGDLGETHHQITRSGLADMRVKVSVNLVGNPAVSPEEFARSHRDRVLLGASLTISAPTGQYDPTKLINLGTNRWAFKPELGVSVPWKNFDFDAYAGVVFFTTNPSFYPGTLSRQQDPLATVQAHASYTFRPGLWLALDGTWYGGGDAHVNDGPAQGRLDNTRVGVTLSVPLGRKGPLGRNQSVKLAYSRGASVRFGSNFDTIGAAWSIRWR